MHLCGIIFPNDPKCIAHSSKIASAFRVLLCIPEYRILYMVISGVQIFGSNFWEQYILKRDQNKKYEPKL